MPEPAKQPVDRPELSRDLGVSHASAIVVGTIIGSGIFLVPAEMMQAVGSARLVYLAWMVGGASFAWGAITYAELGAMKPQSRGRVRLYPRRLRASAGVSLWLDVVCHRQASYGRDADYRAGSHSRHLSRFPGISQLSGRKHSRNPLAVTYGQLVAMAAAVLHHRPELHRHEEAPVTSRSCFTALKSRDHSGHRVVLAFTATASGTGWRNFATTFSGAKAGFAGFMAALVAALWAYDGWNDLNMVSRRNP
jgi:APA family basic amino acid/polyamine antiporter